MARLSFFNTVSLDGYFTDPKGDLSWAHAQDPEWLAFVDGNAQGDGVLLFGRITYEMMARWWPTPAALEASPVVAQRMNNARKVVFSRTLAKAAWSNTRLVKEDLPGEVRKMKNGSGPDIVILGSGTIVSQLAQEGLIDEYQVVVYPIILGKGRTMFESVREKLPVKTTSVRAFKNGNVVLCYEPMKR